MLAKENLRLFHENQVLKQQDKETVIKTCALNLRDELKHANCKQPWPPQPDTLDNQYATLPKCLLNFLRLLLTGNLDSQPSSKVQRLIQSFGQDYIYAVSGGTQKTAKHILLPWAVKSLTGNVEVIKFLNRLGHGISYSQLEELDTALCLQKLATADESTVVVPSSIIPCIPTNLAYDNIDRLEETLSGGGTSHRVNGIIVQPRVPTVEPAKNLQTTVKSKTRSIQPPPLLLTPYNAGNRVGPPIMRSMAIDCDKAVQDAQIKNQVYQLP
jgi:hypothetical protein